MEDTKALLLARELRLLNSAENRALYFHGESMLPFFREGDEIIVRPVRWEQIRIGDMITYRLGDKFPTRRVVRKLNDSLQLWCENWPDRRFRAAKSDVLGRVVARARGGSWLSRDESAWKRATRRALLRFYARTLVNKARRACSRAGKRLGGPAPGS